MADLSVTATSVIAGADGVFESGVAGVSITAGQAVYKEPGSHSYLLADCNAPSIAARTALGIALNGGAAGQPIKIQKSGSITIGATLTGGVAYYLSGTAGGLRPVADNTTGDYPCVIGIATSTTVLKLNITPAGVAL